jgi:hypothetical protein
MHLINAVTGEILPDFAQKLVSWMESLVKPKSISMLALVLEGFIQINLIETRS